ncbi:MAG: hypothetical protein SFU25_01785 [Candidatus Caenarcaniphilales bacterium]|nr:hypothetical protein [Candidatus Caenarcaniphilales bacterium]
MRPWTFAELEEFVKSKGYSIEKTKNNEWKVINSKGNPIEFFAVAHGKGPNREVKVPYIKKIQRAIEEDDIEDDN